MRDELDSLIDGGLAAYGNVEPLAGLEERVLGRVRAQQRSRRWCWVLVPVAAAAAMAVVMIRPRTVDIAPPVVALTKPPAPLIVAPSRTATRVVVREAPKRTTLPKREVFPTIALLTREERLLLRLAESHPEDLARPVVPQGEIEIKPIEIAPLTIDGGQ
jgi:hypothetical protein